MSNSHISCQINEQIKKPKPPLIVFADEQAANSAYQFHQSLPNYQPTPLVRLSKLANYLGVNSVLVKDESKRFDLNAFKILGASFAIAKHLSGFLKLKNNELTFDKIIARRSEYQHLTFVTATDGNHGRAVAWAANKFGCQSVVYMPKGSSLERLEAIKRYGAQASITTMNYDNTVIHANQKAEENNWVLVQDTTWQGYKEIPESIMQGYCTLLTEYLEQIKNPEQTQDKTETLDKTQADWPTHVFVQAGVGSLAAAIFAFFCNVNERQTPKFIVVEPHGAPCFYESSRQNKLFTVTGNLPTIMAGLACGEPSYEAWAILKPCVSAFLKCSDDVARRGMRVLGNPMAGDQSIVSGESGAVTLGAVFEILTQSDCHKIKESLQLTSCSNILLFSTEGDTDPAIYRKIVW